jgi:D-alanyl-D-alanine carboxypeptidase
MSCNNLLKRQQLCSEKPLNANIQKFTLIESYRFQIALSISVTGRIIMALKRLLAPLFLLFICAPHLSTKAQNPDVPLNRTADNEILNRILAKVQSKLDEFRISSKFPGATVGFVLPDGRSGSVSTGVADLGNHTPLKPSDRLLAGSIGKTFVAAVTLQLVQEGKIKLDEKIAYWLGNERWFGQLPNAQDITLRMLLNHSSGIQNHVDRADYIQSLIKNAARDVKYEELISYVLNKKPLFQAGHGYNYSDTSYILVGMIIEKVTGKTLYEEVAQRILNPLKLERTIPSNSRSLPQVANGYFQNEPVIVKDKFVINPQWEWAGGGFASTPEDLAHWAKALYEGNVLQSNSLDEMLHSTSTGDGANYGLGVEIVQSRWGKSYGHDGEFPGYLSDMRYFPKHRIAVAVQVNSDETPGVNQFMASAVDEFARIIIREISSRKLSENDKARLQSLTENWLKLLDNGKFAENWEELSTELKAKYIKEKWQTALQPLIDKVGKIKTRKFKNIDYSEPEADIVVVDTESSFTKLASTSEIVILKLEADRKWHIASYWIK